MGDDARVRHLIRLRVLYGQLPGEGWIEELRIGLGDGKPCDGCGRVITKDDTSASAAMFDTWKPVRLHIGCYNIWSVERDRAA
jgi:hypothetical protein